ncbi:MAG: GMC family oxidoreductase [Sorangiineae bacterium]|nr:GMC family oxidoreductase [Polyangiaceae bacterium]MEB2322848.1 GMC family oxidoreductase [Sorangiineae bacterium]
MSAATVELRTARSASGARADELARAREVLGARGFRVARALALAVLPSGSLMPGADDATLVRLAKSVASFGSPSGYLRLLDLLEFAPLATTGKRFSALEPERGAEFLARWHEGSQAARGAFIALTYPLKNAHFDDRDVYRTLGCVWENPPVHDEVPRHMQRVTPASELDAHEVLECDVVVVGTGAGGAVVAKELAERGVAVLLIEQGEYYTRKDFIRRSVPGMRKLYKNAGINGVVGNCVIPIPLGKDVGGSTTINSGTCLRAPDWIFEKWQSEHGLTEFTPEAFDAYYSKVERTLEVAPSDPKVIGAAADIIARGCDKLGWSHFPVPRNAPGCDGQGVCQWGCPTDAKKSMNVSYVPLALDRGASLVTGLTVQRVWLEGGRAVGVIGKRRDGATIRVRSRGTILACGSLATPVLLLRQGIANSSGMVGRNLTIHPATGVSGVFDDEIRGWNRVPQGYGVTQFHRDGILILGAGAPLDVGATMFPMVGRRYMDLMSAYSHVASFGVMVEDEPNGRIVLGPRGRPLMLYQLGVHERRLLARGSAAIARIFYEAGSREIYTEIRHHHELHTLADIERLERACPGGFDLMMIGFHPLGTCRMGADPTRSVVDASCESHDVPGLYIVDGSAVPSSIAVNTQLTIMALATRTAEKITSRFD